ncbi:M48 family metalloprotease [Sphingomonas quercus]|uniref:M48 family metalloprotease n=1 Tax=Sphingomonas quercus TaxID=2842451 RepID=A0ABS6BM75_9SPHN|nr:M48 family metalloprotease [Sphingomonas quercus]MBU3078310.1 M48 family metalloprotease [Sphingomonas quercus]
MAFPTRLLRGAVALILSLVLAAEPVLAQGGPSVLRDTETESFLRDISEPLAVAAGLAPGHLQVVLLNDPEINAFVAGGQIVYINSGTLLAADSVQEVQGVIAHEIGHIVGGHIALAGQNTRAYTNVSILSLLLGAAAIAAGAGEAGMAAMMMGQSAAIGKYLAFSRAQESSADAAAIRFLNNAHLSGRGLISFFGKLRNQEYRLSPSYTDIDPYMQTHPMSADRQEALSGDVEKSPWYGVPEDPALHARLARIKGKLFGFLKDPPETLRKYPEKDQSEGALYARAYAWHKGAYPDKAVAEIDKLVALKPHDPYYLELKGQILLEGGKPALAIAPLREAVERSNNAPLIASLLGHALIATEDSSHFGEARQVLKLALARDEDNPFAWYALGMVYDREGDQPRAAMATAERYSLMGQPRLALGAAEAAMRGIPVGTPDYIRAQDIALASRGLVEQEKKRR